MMTDSYPMSDEETLRHYRVRCSWPNLYYGVVAQLCDQIRGKRFLEIGVAYGYHALDMLTRLPDTVYYGVDPYLAGYDPNDGFAVDAQKLFAETSPQKGMDRLHSAVQATLSPYSERTKLIRKKSVEAATEFPAHFFDSIFVDGDHTYEGVVADLHAWWGKLRVGGIYCGDDYTLTAVQRAVQEFAKEVAHELHLVAKPDTQYPIWVITKK